MKHFFFLHSHITWLVAVSLIQHDSLTPSSTLFVCCRGYNPPESGLPVELAKTPAELFPDTVMACRSPCASAGAIRSVDDFIQATCHEEQFYAYFPQCSSSLFHIVSKHPLCKGFNLLEEGFAGFNAEYPTKIKRRLKFYKYLKAVALCPNTPITHLVSKGRIPLVRYFYEFDYDRAFAIHPKSFNMWPRRVQLAMKPPINTIQPSLPSRPWLLALDSSIDIFQLDPEALKVIWIKMLDKLRSLNVSTLHIKLHPEQTREDGSLSDSVKNLLAVGEGKLNIVLLPKTASIEVMCINHPIQLIVCISSLAYYVQITSPASSIYTIAPMIASLDTAYSKSASYFAKDFKDFFAWRAQDQRLTPGI